MLRGEKLRNLLAELAGDEMQAITFISAALII
jgi:hypothetical protein